MLGAAKKASGSKEMRLSFLDSPGHGRSDPLPLGTPQAGEAFYDRIRRALDTFEAPFILIGHSLGGGVALRYARETVGPRLKGLVLISPAGGFGSRAEYEEFRAGVTMTTLKQARLFAARLYHRTPLYYPIVAPYLYWVLRRPTMRSMLDQARASDFGFDFDALPPVVPPDLGALRSLLIWGESERLFPASHIDRLRHLLGPQMGLIRPEATGHCPQLERPAWLWEALRQFAQESYSLKLL